MKRKAMAVLAAGLVAGLAGTMAFGVVGMGHAAEQSHVASHFYFLKPGHSKVFNLPGGVNRVEVAVSFEGPPTEKPKSEVMTALVGYDGNTHHLSWIGTNSNGAQRGRNDEVTRTVARICGTTCKFILAKLHVTTGPQQLTLTLTKHAGSSADFTVNVWY